MKYLKRFNESVNMNQYLSDIFLELEDEGYKVIVDNNDNFHSSASVIAYHKVIIHGKTFKLKDIFEVILSADDYMSDNKGYINSMRFRTWVSGSNGISGSVPEWFSLNYTDIEKLKAGEISKEVLDIDYIEIEFKTH